MKQLLGVVVVVMFSGLAQADTFTFTNKMKVETQISIPFSDGSTMFAVRESGSGKSVTSSGKEISTSIVCFSMSMPPSDLFDARHVCEVSSKQGVYGATGSCQTTGEEEGICWGAMIGKTGTFKERTGTYTTQGKKGQGRGVAQWND